MIVGEQAVRLAAKYAIAPRTLENTAVDWLPLTTAFSEALRQISDLAIAEDRMLDYATLWMELRPERDVLRNEPTTLQLRVSICADTKETK